MAYGVYIYIYMCVWTLYHMYIYIYIHVCVWTLYHMYIYIYGICMEIYL